MFKIIFLCTLIATLNGLPSHHQDHKEVAPNKNQPKAQPLPVPAEEVVSSSVTASRNDEVINESSVKATDEVVQPASAVPVEQAQDVSVPESENEQISDGAYLKDTEDVSADDPPAALRPRPGWFRRTTTTTTTTPAASMMTTAGGMTMSSSMSSEMTSMMTSMMTEASTATT